MDWYILLLIINILIFIVFPFWIYQPSWTIFLFIYCPLYLFYWFWVPNSQQWIRYNCFTQWLIYSYFNIKIIDPNNTLEYAKNAPVIFALHPHGVFAVSLFALFGMHPETQHVTIGCSSILFNTPILKEAVGVLGCVSVKKNTLIDLLQKKQSIAICPGGLRELLNNDGNWVTKRKGFISIAQETGAFIVLIKATDELSLYNVWIPKCMYPLQHFFLHYLLYPFFIFSWGNLWCPFWPKRPQQMRLEFGPLIACPKNAKKSYIRNEIYKK